MGEQAFEKQQWNNALEHYRRALKLDKSSHEVFFGLAKTYFELVTFNAVITICNVLKTSQELNRNRQTIKER